MFSKLINSIKKYIATSLEVYKLEIIEKVVLSISALVGVLIAFSVCIGFIGFVSVAFAFFIDGYIGNLGISFLLAALFFVLLNLIIFAFRRKILINPILRFVMTVFNVIEKRIKDDDEN